MNHLLTGNRKLDSLIKASLQKQGYKEPVVEESAIIVDEATNLFHVAKKEDRTYSDGCVFASASEMVRWDELLKIQSAGEIKDLEKQVVFVLQEAFISKQYGEVKPIIYVADFVYTDISYRKGREGRKVVEDSKTGVRTKEYKIKRKMMLYRYAEYLFFEV